MGHEITTYSFCLREATAVSLQLHFQLLKLPTFVDLPGTRGTLFEGATLEIASAISTDFESLS